MELFGSVGIPQLVVVALRGRYDSTRFVVLLNDGFPLFSKSF